MVQTSSNAKVFFEDLFSHPDQTFEKLKQLVATGAEENEWREFKGASATTYAQGTEKEKKREELRHNWSKAISAFANSSGGVLIWGIDAPDKHAENLNLAKDANELANDLSGLVNSAVIPAVHGIQVIPVTDGSLPTGLVVCFIPASRYAPHQSNWPRQFYMRCQDGSHECGYTELKRLFQPSLSPAFESNVRLEVQRLPDGVLVTSGILWLKNIGNASAHDIFLTYGGGVQLAPRVGVWVVVPESSNAFTTEWSIHPDQTLQVASNVFKRIGPPELEEEFAFQFQLKIYVRDAPPMMHGFRVKSSDINEAVQRGGSFQVFGEDI